MGDKRTFKIIGAAIEVHKELGCGFLEGVYQEALAREFRIQEIPNKAQPIVVGGMLSKCLEISMVSL